MKILIIEDFEGDIALLEARLEAIGAEVVVAKSAADGMRLAREEQPGLIVTDLNLGRGMEEGIEMIATMRKDPEIAGIPLIIHSVFVSAPGDIQEATSLADGFLPKPYKFVDLATIVEKMRA